MKASMKTLFLCGIIVLAAYGCEEKEEILPPNHAKGEIIQIFGGCYGEWVMIEIENPKGIGLPGTFIESSQNKDTKIEYKNAIGVPWFSKLLDINDTLQSIGNYLYFEYRNVTEEEIDLFRTIPPPVCPANIIPPPTKCYIITKIIEVK